MMPNFAMALQTAISTFNQASNFACSDQISAISGRLYLSITDFPSL
jgi:hypothetical protein